MCYGDWSDKCVDCLRQRYSIRFHPVAIEILRGFLVYAPDSRSQAASDGMGNHGGFDGVGSDFDISARHSMSSISTVGRSG